MNALFDSGFGRTSLNYAEYMYQHLLMRKVSSVEDRVWSMLNDENQDLKEENSNKNPVITSIARDYMAGELSREIARKKIFDEECVAAHDQAIIHIADMDYAAQTLTNCELINLDDMLQNGTVINRVLIEKPKSLTTACTVASQIAAQVASQTYGGQSISLYHISKFVDVSRQKHRKNVAEEFKAAGIELNEEKINEIAELRTRQEIKSAVQLLQYQTITIQSSNGQSAFQTMFMYLDEAPEGPERDDLALMVEEVMRQRMNGIKNEKGQKIMATFPKLIFVLDEDNIYEDSPYYYLTELAAECVTKTMQPDFQSAKVLKELKGGVWSTMGCRSFLTPDNFSDKIGNVARAKNFIDGEPKYWGRLNMGVVTISLPDVALSSGGDFEKFWKIFDERLELCHRVCQTRIRRLEKTKAKVSPIMWMYGACSRLESEDTLDQLLGNGYATISIGYAGLAECVYAMTGKSHISTDEGKKFGLKVMQHMNDKCAEWREKEGYAYSVYGTPIESTTYKFAKGLQNRFGIVEGVSDHNSITNSYHCKVDEPINIFDKLSIESEFQALSPGGAVSYGETINMSNNIPAVLTVLKHIYENIMYAELNTKLDRCHLCGFEGEFPIVRDEHNKLIYECPACFNRNPQQFTVIRRICGYLSSYEANQGRMDDIERRVIHL